MATLIENLDAINKCKEDIKTALVNKGVDMTGVVFSSYYEKINSLQLESGDTPSEPSTPTPSSDYIYSNGYITGGDVTNDIITFTPYEIILDENGEFTINLTCPAEIPVYTGQCDIIFTVDIPKTYTISNFIYHDAGTDTDYPQDYKQNPRNSTIIRNGVEYNSYVRSVEDGNDYGSEYVAYDPLQYIITIKKS